MNAGTAWSTRLAGMMAAALAAAALTTVPASAQSDPGGAAGADVVAFDSAAPIGPSSLSPMNREKLQAAKRARFVDLSTTQVAAALDSSDVGIELFPDVVAQLDGEGPRVAGANGSTTWSGLADDGDYATLTFLGGQTVGTVAVDGVVYDISPVSGGTHLITQEGRDFPDEADPVEAPAPPGDGQDGAPAPSAPEVTPVVDVLTWYDDGAVTAYGGDAAAQSELAATINETNAAYARSGVNQSVRSVGIEHVTYTGTGVANTELSRLQSTSDGILDAVHTRRNQVAADLVALISPLSDACGIGYLGGPASGSQGFSVNDPGCARGNLSYAHELGHNMGAGHGPPDGGGLFSYSNGFRDLVNGFRTIMAYNSSSCPGGSCPRVAYFSGPVALFNGHPVGSATFDNARTISERAATTAAYRSAVVNRPANDAFAAAQALTGTAGNVSGTNVNATKESGEPNHSYSAGGTSVWYRWTAPNSGQATVETCGSGFDTLLAAYTGTAVNALYPIAADDDGGGCGGNTSRISFTATGGTTYRIAVDGYNAASGTVTLAWNLTIPRPPNDKFADAAVLSGRATSATGTNVGATRQSGEPLHHGRAGDTSIWYRWVAPRTERVEVNTIGSSFDTLLGVYHGVRVSALTRDASNDDMTGSRQSRARFNAVAGRLYRIAVAGYQDDAGSVRLQVKPA